MTAVDVPCLSAHWTARLTTLAAKHRVPGATLGIWAGGQEILAAHGVLSTATEVGVTTGSLFQIGSITKVWTASMIMQLAEEERLSLDSTVAELLPGARLGDPDGSAEITVAHLLTHTSGLEGDIFNDTGRGDGCVRRYVADLATVDRNSPPGAVHSYCNSGFCVLGRMIEVLDGRTWDESLRQRLIRPLGLTATVTLPEEAILHRAAVGHKGHPHEDEACQVWALPRSAGPAGTIVASPHDVLVFARMHTDGGVTRDGTRLLAGESVAAMQQARVSLPAVRGDLNAMGLGWQLGRWDGQPVIGHDGGTVGQTAYLRAAPEAGVAACLLTNASDANLLYRDLFAEVFDEFAGIGPPSRVEPTAGPVDLDLDRHTGRYERVSQRFDVSVRDGELHLLSTRTNAMNDTAGSEPEDVVLHPCAPGGDRFVGRSGPGDPWVEFVFGQIPDGPPYLHVGGRLNPRVELQSPGLQSPAIEIRPFETADRDGVMALAPRLTEWVSPWRDADAVLTAVRGWVSDSADHAGDDDHAFYVAVAGGRIVGLVTVSAQAHFSGQVDAYVSELAVAQAWQGRGIGGRLMAAAERWAAGRGLSFITLHTGAANGPARGLYDSLGFTLEDVRLTKPVAQPA